MNIVSAFRAKAAMSPRSRRVTDAPTRVFHGLFALSFIGAYLTGDSERWRLVHLTLGYTLAGLLVFRLMWGTWGPRQTRWSLLAHKLAGWTIWFQGLRQGKFHARHGQNLVMASAGVALLLLTVPLSLSGYAAYDDAAKGWDHIHLWLAQAMLGLLSLHLGLIALLSWLRGPHQAATMFSGRIPGPGPDLVTHNHTGIAMLLLITVLLYWSWPW
ncbi:MAG: cytochrome b/b6 domain-containing protein [Leptothrix ochracea]|uniref:cytochrome b/b6 domain-containing protein n=1 Tax=Leptothrix ochracea TaxID=735331 RepID=UPI0034E24025